MHKKKLLIFDLDGTLINTLMDLNTAVNYALDKYDYPLRTITQTKNDIGNGVAKLIERSIPGGLDNPNYPDTLRVFKEYYKAHYFDFSKPYPGVREVLIELKKRGYLLAVVSNKFDEGAKKLVAHFYSEIFDQIQGAIPELGNKPSPDLVNKVLSELDVKNTQEVLYIGDTNVDYETAVNSNIDCVLVSYGYRSREQLLEQTKNSPIIDSISELLNLI